MDKLTLSPASLSTCISSGATQQFTATAFSNGTDVTSTVGTINWLSTTTSVATVDANGLATAATPGGSTIFANVGNVTSLPVPFTTCPPKSISLHIQNAGDTSFTLDAAATQQLTADVTDINGNPVANAPLTYTVLPSAVGSVSGAGLATAVVPGVGEIVASCTPPTCNINLNYPVYSNLVTMNVNGTSAPTIYAVSISGVTLASIPVDNTGAVGTISTITLPQSPTSMIMAATGLHAYLGSSAGLMPVDLNANTVGTIITAAPGKVLAVSPREKKVITADATHAYVVDLTNNNAVTTLPIVAATAADFSPDEFEAYIAAGNAVYVYSRLFTLRSTALNGAANDISFLTSGQFAYVATKAPGVTALRSCDVPPTVADAITTPGEPKLIRSLPNATQLIAADSPGVDVITPALNAGSGCGPA